ncbi:helix-turn-helix domain-containing protein [Candidatus Poribacteria bacterium]
MKADSRPIKKSYLTVAEAAEHTAKHPQTIYYQLRNIKHKRFGGKIYINRSALRKYYGIEEGSEK